MPTEISPPPSAAPTAVDDPSTALRVEFERQLGTLVALGYPWLAGMTDEAFRAHLAPLAARLGELGAGAPVPPAGEVDGDGWLRRVPFVIAIGRELVDPERAAALVQRRGRDLVVSMLDAEAFAAFRPIESVTVPPGGAYLLADVDTGVATRNDPPDVALERIAAEGRSVLTLEEGIAFVTHHTEAVATNAGFSLVGSRRGDRRVTALWVSRGAPKLGWCFAGVPHTWLGSASCARRLGGRAGGTAQASQGRRRTSGTCDHRRPRPSVSPAWASASPASTSA